MPPARRLLTALTLLALTFLTAGSALSAPRASLPDIEDEVMCPVCGTPLELAESPQANRERVFIQRLIDRGETKAEIKDALEQEYGPAVLALPQAHGFGLSAYLVPVGLGAVSLIALAFALPRWRRRGRQAHAGADPDSAPAPPAVSPTDTARLDEDLARHDP